MGVGGHSRLLITLELMVFLSSKVSKELLKINISMKKMNGIFVLYWLKHPWNLTRNCSNYHHLSPRSKVFSIASKPIYTERNTEKEWPAVVPADMSITLLWALCAGRINGSQKHYNYKPTKVWQVQSRDNTFLIYFRVCGIKVIISFEFWWVCIRLSDISRLSL